MRVTPTPQLPPIALDPEGVVFDMDGVLCDSEPLWADARFGVAEALGSRSEEHTSELQSH